MMKLLYIDFDSEEMMLILKKCLSKALFQKEILCKSRDKIKKTFVKRNRVKIFFLFFGRNFCVSVNIIVTCVISKEILCYKDEV